MIDSQPTHTTLTATPETETDRKRQELTRLIFQGVVLALVIGLAATYRLYNLTEVGYNSDEAVYSGQAAAIAKVPILTEHFPIFRAHPLLFQFALAVVYTFGANEWLGRALSAFIGIATVLLTYALGKRLYGFQVGVLAALFLALMPYHVVPTRQVLLDGSMTFAATLTLFLLARFSATERPILLYAAGAAMGLTVLAKETGILMVGAIYAFIALTPKVRVRLTDLIVSLFTMGLVVAVYPLSVSLAGGGGGGKTQQYLVWQLFRRPNHTWDFYPTVVPPAMGFLVIAAALVGLWLLRSENSWREKLLFLWILVPVAFFQLWPTKGFQYLLPAAAPMAILAARTLTLWPRKPLRLGQFKVP
ncbi:MAG: glycosyltransferase family 39 protein [Trueperaceae bacterium]|nr:MAG: glycosyltransferase family 39 protein [Trueperaceae bacterium]